MRIGQGRSTPEASNHSLYLIKLFSSFSYPEGNFGVNQLLDGSISLSPLSARQKNDLHVSISTSLHQSFLWLHPAHAKFTIFRVPSCVLRRDPFLKTVGRCCIRFTRLASLTFVVHSGLPPKYSHTCWDPKDGELCLRRVKPGETLVEARSDSDVQIDRQMWV